MPSRHKDRVALLRTPNAHRGKLILIIKTHWSRCKLVFRNHFSSECPAILRVTWKPRVRQETSHMVSSAHDRGKGRVEEPCRCLCLPAGGTAYPSQPHQLWPLSRREAVVSSRPPPRLPETSHLFGPLQEARIHAESEPPALHLSGVRTHAGSCYQASLVRK